MHQQTNDSELQLQRKLHRAWTALLVLRCHRAEACVQSLRGLPKGGIRERRIDVTEVRMVEEIEGLGAELQVEIPVDREFAPDGKVQLRGSESSNKIPRGIPD